jgi:hypothetical protein
MFVENNTNRTKSYHQSSSQRQQPLRPFTTIQVIVNNRKFKMNLLMQIRVLRDYGRPSVYKTDQNKRSVTDFGFHQKVVDNTNAVADTDEDDYTSPLWKMKIEKVLDSYSKETTNSYRKTTKLSSHFKDSSQSVINQLRASIQHQQQQQQQNMNTTINHPHRTVNTVLNNENKSSIDRSNSTIQKLTVNFSSSRKQSDFLTIPKKK